MTHALSSSSRLSPRAAVFAMDEYHPPLADRRGLRLDFNENTLAPSPRVASALQKFSADAFTRYPEREPVERIVASHLARKPAQVLLTNGVDEAIHLVCETFLEPGSEALIATPTFGMYGLCVQMTGASLVTVQAAPDFRFPFEGLLARITARTRMIAFASPNNPTGSIATRQQILDLCQAAPQAAVLVDEAYIHFGGETVIEEINAVPNLIVARTFSKAYGLAGLRIGLLAAHEDTLRWIRKVASPYNVNAIALGCLPAALDDDQYLRWYVEQALASRSVMGAELDRLQVPHWPSHANFILMRIGARHAEFVQGMRQRGVLVRDRSRDPGCEGCVRITMGSPQQTSDAIEALRATLSEFKWSREEATA